MIEQENGDEDKATAERPRKAKPVKATSPAGSVIVSEIQKNWRKNRIRVKGT